MATPTLLFNSSSGSDTAASGAGPSTALTGSDGSTDGAGTTITVPNQDLTNVATDGSHVIYVQDATAGNRNFGVITGKANSGTASANVTVAEAFGLGLSSQTYAIGGKRQTLDNTNSRKIFTNNASTGDAQDTNGGWIVQLESGYTETITANIPIRVTTTNTRLPLTLRGDPDATTTPIVTFSNNGEGFSVIAGNAGVRFENLDIRNSNVTKTASYAIANDGSCIIKNVRVADATNNFWRAFWNDTASAYMVCINCEVAETASDGIVMNADAMFRLIACHVHDCGDAGFRHGQTGSSNMELPLMFGCIFANNTGNGVELHRAGVDSFFGGVPFINCVFDNNTSGCEIGADTSNDRSASRNVFINCIFSNNTTGLEFPNWAGGTTTAVRKENLIYNCNFYNNTTDTQPAGIETNAWMSNSNFDSDPGYFSTTNGNYATPELAMLALGYPSRIGFQDNETTAFWDVGASQVPNRTGSRLYIASTGFTQLTAAATDLLELKANVNPLRIHEVSLYQSSTYGAANAQALKVSIKRAFGAYTSGTGSTATVTKLGSSGGAGGPWVSTASFSTTQATGGTIDTIYEVAANIQAGFTFLPTPVMRPNLEPGEGLIVAVAAPAGSIDGVLCRIVFEEM